MAMTTMLALTTLGGFVQREDIDMHYAAMPMGSRGGQDGEGGCSFVFGGSGPLPRELG